MFCSSLCQNGAGLGCIHIDTSTSPGAGPTGVRELFHIAPSSVTNVCTCIYCLPFLRYASIQRLCHYLLAMCVLWTIASTEPFIKIFSVGSPECIHDIRQFLGLRELGTLIEERRSKFTNRLFCVQDGFRNMFLAV